ncbi:MAG: glutathione S-transferase N-terminal domain-containing protein [Methylophaga sp.]|jgi:RNA polymerase-associated protein|nr:glutathione S-transferase N-terminal domain-containing protein [Methylophaga sp.]MEC9314481.1 glutathione S-transferase N-terminal domain-containing protein [Pseudomonadota bacterium]MED5510905.1 glutathione S-transferase N-terminal domain-containing protein [Pseudomonadota bacterium]
MNNRRSMMTVYSDPACPFSHQMRIVIQEKEIDAELEELTPGEWPEEVAAANPYGFGPTLFDRDLVLFDSRVIIDYFDERFPHPPLMPVDPVARAKVRLMLHRIDKDWYSLWDALSGRERGKGAKARKIIQEDLTVLSPLFENSKYFMSDEFSLLDCTLAPLLWRLPSLNIKLPDSARGVENYARRIFERDSFQASLSDIERAMR